MTEPVLLGWSGGKDSALALQALRASDRYEVVGLLTTVTSDFDRVSMHGVRRDLVVRQAERAGLPLIESVISAGAGNAEYEAALLETLAPFRREGLRRVAFGDLYLEDIRAYRGQLLARGGMSCLFPIWGRETRELAEQFVRDGFRAHLCCIDPRRLDRSFVGRVIDDAFLADLPPDVDPCGENGEFHTFVSDGPILDRPVPVLLGDVVERDGFVFQDLQLGD